MRLENREMIDKDLNILTDESIVKMAQEGSSTAYEFLISKYRGLAKNKSKSYFIAGGDNEDVIQEGMIGIYKAIRDFDEEQNAAFRTFVEICINRQIITAIKTANRQKHQILNESLSLNVPSAQDSDDAPVLAEILAANSADTDPEEMMLMKEVVDYLKANERNLFSNLENEIWNQMLKGRNYREIAVAMGCSAKTVDNAIQRIKKKIQNFLEE